MFSSPDGSLSDTSHLRREIAVAAVLGGRTRERSRRKENESERIWHQISTSSENTTRSTVKLPPFQCPLRPSRAFTAPLHQTHRVSVTKEQGIYIVIVEFHSLFLDESSEGFKGLFACDMLGRIEPRDKALDLSTGVFRADRHGTAALALSRLVYSIRLCRGCPKAT